MSISAPELPTINLTDHAAAKIDALSAASGGASRVLRVYIEGGGCSGFQYGFAFEENPGDEDFVVERGGVKLAVDPLSFQYLMGSEVDYTEDLSGARFVVRNPNASTTCGCGASFGI